MQNQFEHCYDERMGFDITVNIQRSLQRALLGEVPPSLRCLYARIEHGVLHYHAVFTDDASDDEVECAHTALTEVIADCPPDIRVNETIERNGAMHWRIDAGRNLMFLRHGEMDR